MIEGERLNSLTHLFGTVLAVAGCVALGQRVAAHGDVWKTLSAVVFGAALIALYGASAAYHASRGPAKEWLRRVDHCAIFVLIAGTYTPFTLVTLRGTLGAALFATIWLAALYGIQRAWRAPDESDPSPWPYVAMGWCGVVAVVPLLRELGASGVSWIACGGALYTAGIVFYLNDERWRHAHGVWHVFVMAGSAAHFVVIWRIVR